MISHSKPFSWIYDYLGQVFPNELIDIIVYKYGGIPKNGFIKAYELQYNLVNIINFKEHVQDLMKELYNEGLECAKLEPNLKTYSEELRYCLNKFNFHSTKSYIIEYPSKMKGVIFNNNRIMKQMVENNWRWRHGSRRRRHPFAENNIYNLDLMPYSSQEANDEYVERYLYKNANPNNNKIKEYCFGMVEAGGRRVAGSARVKATTFDLKLYLKDNEIPFKSNMKKKDLLKLCRSF